MTNVYTKPMYRSKGIGGQLLETVNVWSKEQGLSFMMVWPSETSVDFYKKLGFERSKEMMENHFV